MSDEKYCVSERVLKLLNTAIDVIASDKYNHLEFGDERERDFMEHDVLHRLNGLHERVETFIIKATRNPSSLKGKGKEKVK